VTTYSIDVADRNPIETKEWFDSLSAVVNQEGQERAEELLRRVLSFAVRQGAVPPLTLNTDYT
jgi:pyruvate dehydrogenase E1 component